MMQHNPMYVRCTSENLESPNVIIVSGFTCMNREVIEVVKTSQTVTTFSQHFYKIGRELILCSLTSLSLVTTYSETFFMFPKWLKLLDLLVFKPDELHDNTINRLTEYLYILVKLVAIG